MGEKMIQNLEISLFLLLGLIALSYIDIKKREFPAVLTTAVLFVVALVQIDNLAFGVLAFIFALFLTEADFISGGADLKVIVMLGLMVSDLGMFFLMMIITLIFGTVYKVLMVKVVKQKDETAFIPVLLVVYIALMIVQAII